MNTALARLVTQASTQIEDFFKKDVQTAQKTSPQFVTDFERTIASIMEKDPKLGKKYKYNLDHYKMCVERCHWILRNFKDPTKCRLLFEEGRIDLKEEIEEIQSEWVTSTLRGVTSTLRV
jgi:hypothetical protein